MEWMVVVLNKALTWTFTHLKVAHCEQNVLAKFQPEKGCPWPNCSLKKLSLTQLHIRQAHVLFVPRSEHLPYESTQLTGIRQNPKALFLRKSLLGTLSQTQSWRLLYYLFCNLSILPGFAWFCYLFLHMNLLYTYFYKFLKIACNTEYNWFASPEQMFLLITACMSFFGQLFSQNCMKSVNIIFKSNLLWKYIIHTGSAQIISIYVYLCLYLYLSNLDKFS